MTPENRESGEPENQRAGEPENRRNTANRPKGQTTWKPPLTTVPTSQGLPLC